MHISMIYQNGVYQVLIHVEFLKNKFIYFCKYSLLGIRYTLLDILSLLNILKITKTSPITLSNIHNYVPNKHTIHNILVLNVSMCIVYVHHILILIFLSNKFLSRSFFSLLKILEALSS